MSEEEQRQLQQRSSVVSKVEARIREMRGDLANPDVDMNAVRVSKILGEQYDRLDGDAHPRERVVVLKTRKGVLLGGTTRQEVDDRLRACLEALEDLRE